MVYLLTKVELVWRLLMSHRWGQGKTQREMISEAV